jgi:hypothetical protein
MWSLIFIVMCSPGFFGMHKEAYTVATSHVDSFLTKKLCDEAGDKLVKNIHDVDIQYVCVLEID